MAAHRAPVRDRVLQATFDEVGEHGLRGLTLEAVAGRAGISRATLYRHFPGGREQLVHDVIEWEVGRFHERVRAEVGAAPPEPAPRLERLLASAHRLLEEHEVLQGLLAGEAEVLLPSLATVQPMIVRLLAQDVVEILEGADLRPGVDVLEAVEVLVRLVISYVGSGGVSDLTDPVDVTRLVRSHLLLGLLQPAADAPAGGGAGG